MSKEKSAEFIEKILKLYKEWATAEDLELETLGGKEDQEHLLLKKFLEIAAAPKEEDFAFGAKPDTRMLGLIEKGLDFRPDVSAVLSQLKARKGTKMSKAEALKLDSQIQSLQLKISLRKTLGEHCADFCDLDTNEIFTLSAITSYGAAEDESKTLKGEHDVFEFMRNLDSVAFHVFKNSAMNTTSTQSEAAMNKRLAHAHFFGALTAASFINDFYQRNKEDQTRKTLSKRARFKEMFTKYTSKYLDSSALFDMKLHTERFMAEWSRMVLVYRNLASTVASVNGIPKAYAVGMAEKIVLQLRKASKENFGEMANAVKLLMQKTGKKDVADVDQVLAALKNQIDKAVDGVRLKHTIEALGLSSKKLKPSSFIWSEEVENQMKRMRTLFEELRVTMQKITKDVDKLSSSVSIAMRSTDGGLLDIPKVLGSLLDSSRYASLISNMASLSNEIDKQLVFLGDKIGALVRDDLVARGWADIFLNRAAMRNHQRFVSGSRYMFSDISARNVHDAESFFKFLNANHGIKIESVDSVAKSFTRNIADQSVKAAISLKSASSVASDKASADKTLYYYSPIIASAVALKTFSTSARKRKGADIAPFVAMLYNQDWLNDTVSSITHKGKYRIRNLIEKRDLGLLRMVTAWTEHAIKGHHPLYWLRSTPVERTSNRPTNAFGYFLHQVVEKANKGESADGIKSFVAGTYKDLSRKPLTSPEASLQQVVFRSLVVLMHVIMENMEHGACLNTIKNSLGDIELHQPSYVLCLLWYHFLNKHTADILYNKTTTDSSLGASKTPEFNTNISINEVMFTASPGFSYQSWFQMRYLGSATNTPSVRLSKIAPYAKTTLSLLRKVHWIHASANFRRYTAAMAIKNTDSMVLETNQFFLKEGEYSGKPTYDDNSVLSQSAGNRYMRHLKAEAISRITSKRSEIRQISRVFRTKNHVISILQDNLASGSADFSSAINTLNNSSLLEDSALSYLSIIKDFSVAGFDEMFTSIESLPAERQAEIKAEFRSYLESKRVTTEVVGWLFCRLAHLEKGGGKFSHFAVPLVMSFLLNVDRIARDYPHCFRLLCDPETDLLGNAALATKVAEERASLPHGEPWSDLVNLAIEIAEGGQNDNHQENSHWVTERFIVSLLPQALDAVVFGHEAEVFRNGAEPTLSLTRSFNKILASHFGKPDYRIFPRDDDLADLVSSQKLLLEGSKLAFDMLMMKGNETLHFTDDEKVFRLITQHEADLLSLLCKKSNVFHNEFRKSCGKLIENVRELVDSLEKNHTNSAILAGVRELRKMLSSHNPDAGTKRKSKKRLDISAEFQAQILSHRIVKENSELLALADSDLTKEDIKNLSAYFHSREYEDLAEKYHNYITGQKFTRESEILFKAIAEHHCQFNEEMREMSIKCGTLLTSALPHELSEHEKEFSLLGNYIMLHGGISNLERQGIEKGFAFFDEKVERGLNAIKVETEDGNPMPPKEKRLLLCRYVKNLSEPDEVMAPIIAILKGMSDPISLMVENVAYDLEIPDSQKGKILAFVHHLTNAELDRIKANALSSEPMDEEDGAGDIAGEGQTAPEQAPNVEGLVEREMFVKWLGYVLSVLLTYHNTAALLAENESTLTVTPLEKEDEILKEVLEMESLKHDQRNLFQSGAPNTAQQLMDDEDEEEEYKLEFEQNDLLTLSELELLRKLGNDFANKRNEQYTRDHSLVEKFLIDLYRLFELGLLDEDSLSPAILKIYDSMKPFIVYSRDPQTPGLMLDPAASRETRGNQYKILLQFLKSVNNPVSPELSDQSSLF